MIKELIWLRAIACIAVVLVHSISRSIASAEETMPGMVGLIFRTLQTAVLFGTPTFIFISEFLISRKYQSIPKNFLKKRAKFILIPYASMAVFYTFIETLSLGSTFNTSIFYIETLKNVFLGDFHGYFILIIFQFYLLHMFFTRFLSSYPPKNILIISLIINVAYLSFFNFVEPFNFTQSDYVWERASRLPFFGWLFYFTFAYYCGRNINFFLYYLNKYRHFLLVVPVIFFGITIFNRYFMIIESVSSQRVDILFYTLSIICLIYFATSKIKKMPKAIVIINQFSFGIYLLHPFVLSIIPDLSIHYLLRLPISFIISLSGSMVITYLFNKIPFGMFLVGKIGRGYKTDLPKNI